MKGQGSGVALTEADGDSGAGVEADWLATGVSLGVADSEGDALGDSVADVGLSPVVCAGLEVSVGVRVGLSEPPNPGMDVPLRSPVVPLVSFETGLPAMSSKLTITTIAATNTPAATSATRAQGSAARV